MGGESISRTRLERWEAPAVLARQGNAHPVLHLTPRVIVKRDYDRSGQTCGVSQRLHQRLIAGGANGVLQLLVRWGSTLKG